VEAAPPTVESLGRQLTEALAMRRVNSVSIWDGEASVQWLNEGALGPDEHGLVLEAFDQLGADTSLPSCEIALEDGGLGLFLPVRTPSGVPVGVVMILGDARSFGEGAQERIGSPAVRTIMQRLAVLMKPAGITTTSLPALSLLDLVPETAATGETEAPAPQAVPAVAVSEPVAVAPADTATSGISAQAVHDLLEFELAPGAATHSAPASAHTALPGAAGTGDDIPLLQFVDPPVLNAAPAPKAAPAPAPSAPPALKAVPAANVAPALKAAAALRAAAVLKAAAAAKGAPAPKAATPRAVPAAAPVPPTPAPEVQPAPVTRPGRRDNSVAARVNAAVSRARTVPASAPAAAAAPAPLSSAAPAEEEALLTPAALEVAPPRAAPGSVVAGEPAAPAPAPAPVASGGSDPSLILEVLQFGKLRAGGQSRRFQVQARTSAQHARYLPAALDALILERLVSWLAANRVGWSTQPTTFTMNLSIATLEDERFVHRIAKGLNANGLSPEVLGFEITEALCTQRRALVERFLTQCEKLGPWVVVDDFSFDSQVLPLLRSKAVRLVKLDHKLTSTALKDKLSQALVIAAIQAVKVLGIHCAAKQIESPAALQWLTAVGCDFAQGTALGMPQSLDTLLRPAAVAV
jgi:EAL domain-containing protein (putative c-di-GMP-specific phosphodiesterase class I)